MGNQPSKLNLKEQGVADALSVKGSTFYEETIPLALNSECFANTVTIIITLNISATLPCSPH